MSIIASTVLTTEFGEFNVNYHKTNKGTGLSLTKGEIKTGTPLLRIQSSCLFSESFHSITCDCSLQLQGSLKLIDDIGKGAVIYLFDEGRGAGLLNKIKLMEIERLEKIDTVEAFKMFGLPPDLRNYDTAIKILDNINISKRIKLITNNPNKRNFLEKADYNVVSIVSLDLETNDFIKKYLKIKKSKLGHKYIDLK